MGTIGVIDISGHFVIYYLKLDSDDGRNMCGSHTEQYDRLLIYSYNLFDREYYQNYNLLSFWGIDNKIL